MGRSRYKIYKIDEPHYLTVTVMNWTPIFTRPDTSKIIIDSFKYLQNNHNLKLYGYVILENHLHWIAQSDNLPKDINRFKSFTARMLINYFREHNVKMILDKLAFYKKAHRQNLSIMGRRLSPTINSRS